jgi:translation initiation factor IF-3
MFFRGREIIRPEFGQRVFDKIIERVQDSYTIESFPKLQGKSMTMVISPKKRQ